MVAMHLLPVILFITTVTGSNAGTLQEVVNEMWANDADRPTNYSLNWGNKRNGTDDMSPEPLFVQIDERILERPLYKTLNAIHDQELFYPNVCFEENEVNGHKKMYLFHILHVFTDTPVFKIAYKYLENEGYAVSWAGFFDRLWVLWMGTYSRCHGILGSSGFEHVFSGEWKGRNVIGQHSWVKYYRHEKKGEINYHGYIDYKANLIGTFQYAWFCHIKKTGGFFIGTSPAFDFAIFTICALTKPGRGNCVFKLNGYTVSVVTYTQRCSEGTCLSTAYPSF